MRKEFEVPKEIKVMGEFKAYEVKWVCKKGHINHHVALSDGPQNDICLQCGKHYEYSLELLVKNLN